jgi:hypothetical protein
MSLVIALLAILPCLYAVLPRHRQLSFGIKWGLPDWLILILFSGPIVCLEFNDVFVKHGIAFRRPLPAGFTPTLLSEALLISLVVAISIRLKAAGLRRSKLKSFLRLCQELLWSDQSGELLELISEHHKAVFRFSNRKTLWSSIASATRPIPTFDLAIIAELLGREVGTKNDKAKRGKAGLLRALDGASRGQIYRWTSAMEVRLDDSDVVQEFFQSVLLNTHFVNQLVRMRPYLGVDLLSDWPSLPYNIPYFTFLDWYTGALLTHPDSVLYQELRDNQNMTHNRYFLAPTNRLLLFFLEDAKKAHERRIYKPIGDATLRKIKSYTGFGKSDDPYNHAKRDFVEYAIYRDPIYAGIRLFDIMVLEGLHQDVGWHMWLYYLANFVEAMAENYFVDPRFSTGDEEFPNIYAYLIYLSIAALRDFVKAAEDLESPNLQMKFSAQTHENNNIVKSSIFALSQCLYAVLAAEDVNDKFKRYMGEIVFDLYFFLRRHHKLSPYAEVLSYSLKHQANYRHNQAEYLATLRDIVVFHRSEFTIRYDTKGFKALSLELFGFVL